MTNSPLTCLIVDDSKLARMMVAKSVRGLLLECVCIEAFSADDALSKMFEGYIDLAIIAYDMPGPDGLELAAALRIIRPTMPLALVGAPTKKGAIDQANAL